jgi:hypothetical protein
MTQSKHTPGPWRHSKGGPNGCPVVGTDRGLMVCMLSHSVNIPTHIEQAKANASLIAAAPEMLEALKEAQANFKTYDRFKVDVDAMHKIESAIAKAEGQS